MEEQSESRGASAPSSGGLFGAPSGGVPEAPVSPSPSVEAAGSGMASLTRMARVLFMCLRVVIVLVLAYLLVSGVFRVDEQNEAMLFRFGALQKRVLDAEQGETAILTSGRWYWAWPYPIDWVKQLPAQKTVTVSTDRLFEPMVPPERDTRGYLSPGGDGYLMCLNEDLGSVGQGDRRHSNGIVHAVGEVNYRIVDAQKYYLSFYDDSDGQGAAKLELGLLDGESGAAGQPEAVRGTRGIIRLMLGNAIMVEGVSWRVDELRDTTRHVGMNRESFDECVKRRLSSYLDKVDMGIEVQSVKVTIQLPAAVRRDFESVFSASEQSAAMIQLARQEADAMVKAAQSEAFRLVSEAESARDRTISDAEQDSKNFRNELAILHDMGDASSYVETVLLGRYTETLQRIYAKVENKMLVGGDQPSVRLRLGLPEKKRKTTTQTPPQP